MGMKKGIWLNWPGMWVTDNNLKPLEFDTTEDATAWAKEMGLKLEMVTIKEIQ